ncbi:MAG: hypothetical protein U0353_14140 [Sandaracinus sp.]
MSRPLLASYLVVASLSGGCAAEVSSPATALRESATSLRAASEGGDEAPTSRTALERRELADALEHAAIERRALATIAGDEGALRTVVLVEEGGLLRVEAGILGLAALDTPERAIAALHRALSREIDSGPGALFTEEERRLWLEERTRYRDGTAQPDALDVRVNGDEARALTPLGDEIVLRREGAEWRVSSMRANGLE